MSLANSLRLVRSLVWLCLFIVGVVGVTVPILYFYYASQLPQLESELDLEKRLRMDIESERLAVRRAVPDFQNDPKSIEWERPDFPKLPKDLVAFYISQRGCPTYFQTPREDGMPWLHRMVVGLFDQDLPGDGWCEQLFAWRLAERVGVQGKVQLTIATHKIHKFLQKDQLVAYDLASIWFDKALVGVEDLSEKLFRKPLAELDLVETSELTLALPPLGFYSQILYCQNAPLIKQARDSVLQDLLNDKLVTEDRVRNAQAQPVTCTR